MTARNLLTCQGQLTVILFTTPIMSGSLKPQDLVRFQIYFRNEKVRKRNIVSQIVCVLLTSLFFCPPALTLSDIDPLLLQLELDCGGPADTPPATLRNHQRVPAGGVDKYVTPSTTNGCSWLERTGHPSTPTDIKTVSIRSSHDRRNTTKQSNN